MEHLPQKIAHDIVQRLQQLGALGTGLGVPGIDGLKDSPSTWRFINRYRAEVAEAAGDIVEAKTAYLVKLKNLKIAYEDFMDADFDAKMLMDRKRMAHQLMAKQHELQMLQFDALITQAKNGLVVNIPITGDTLEEKIRHAPTLQEKMNLAAASEDSDKQAVAMAGYVEGSREWKETENRYSVLKSKIIRSEL
jgi:hypothetical protein